MTFPHILRREEITPSGPWQCGMRIIREAGVPRKCGKCQMRRRPKSGAAAPKPLRTQGLQRGPGLKMMSDTGGVIPIKHNLVLFQSGRIPSGKPVAADGRQMVLLWSQWGHACQCNDSGQLLCGSRRSLGSVTLPCPSCYLFFWKIEKNSLKTRYFCI